MTVSAITTGSSTKLYRAKRALSASMMMIRPTILTALRNSLIRMSVKTSLMDSTSLVARVTSLPTGVVSKKRIVSDSICAKISLRIS